MLQLYKNLRCSILLHACSLVGSTVIIISREEKQNKMKQWLPPSTQNDGLQFAWGELVELYGGPATHIALSIANEQLEVARLRIRAMDHFLVRVAVDGDVVSEVGQAARECRLSTQTTRETQCSDGTAVHLGGCRGDVQTPVVLARSHRMETFFNRRFGDIFSSTLFFG